MKSTFVEEVLNEGGIIMKDKPVRKNLPILIDKHVKVLGHTHVNKDSTVLFDIHDIKKYDANVDDYGQE